MLRFVPEIFYFVYEMSRFVYEFFFSDFVKLYFV